MGQRSHTALLQGTKSAWDLCCGRAASRGQKGDSYLETWQVGREAGEQPVFVPDARDRSASWSIRRSYPWHPERTELATGHCAPCCVCGAGRTQAQQCTLLSWRLSAWLVTMGGDRRGDILVKSLEGRGVLAQPKKASKTVYRTYDGSCLD